MVLFRVPHVLSMMNHLKAVSDIIYKNHLLIHIGKILLREVFFQFVFRCVICSFFGSFYNESSITASTGL